MDIIVTYDVNTLTKPGRNRLRKVAKICEGFGQRVQYSVFECTVTDPQFVVLRDRLHKVMAADEDSLRIYTLRGGRAGALETYGRDGYMDYEDILIV